MEQTTRWIISLGVALFLLALSIYVIPKFACILLLLLVLVVLVAFLSRALVAGFVKWRKHSSFWLVPSLLCATFLLCSFYLASAIGRYISDKIFERRLGDYSRVITDFRDGNVLCESSCKGDIRLIETPSRPEHVRDVWGTHCDDGGVIILFRADTDVPLLHEGYMFRDYEEGSNCSKLFGAHEFVWQHLPYVRHISENWYRFSDRPGF